MAPPTLFPEHPDDTRIEMLKATYEALEKHGYTALTIDDIDEEFTKSKSLIYQYYDSKDDLLTDFLAYMLEHFESETQGGSTLDPQERLTDLLDNILGPAQETDMQEFTRAIVALRGQAIYNNDFKTQFTGADTLLQSHIESILEEGIESGQFNDVETDRVAKFLLVLMNGALVRRSTTKGDVDVEAFRDEIEEYLSKRLGLTMQ